jgi:hypothetical protein
VYATAKKMAKSMVGKSIGGGQAGAPNVPPVAPSARARTAAESPVWPRHGRLDASHVPGSAVIAHIRAPAGGEGRPARTQPLALSASIRAGSTLCTSPTIPRSATEKMGASWSLLIAMMFLEPFIPTRCWVAPEMPHAT